MIWIVHFLMINCLLIISIIIKNSKIFIGGSFAYSVFVFGQRWLAGVDTPNYLYFYLSGYTPNDGREMGYYGLQNFFIAHNLSFSLLVFTVYFITIFNIYRFIIRLRKNTVIMIYLYMFVEVYFMQMSQMRQFLAISFFLNAYFYAANKKIIKVIFNYLLAISFHLSAIILTPLILFHPRISRSNALIFVIACYMLPLIDIKIFATTGIFGMYAGYVGSAYDVNLSIFHYLKYYAIISIILVYLWNLKICFDSNNDRLIINGLLLYLLIYGLGFQFGIVTRIASYLKIFEIIFLAYYLKDVEYISLRLLKFGLITIFLVFYVGIAKIDPFAIGVYEFKLITLNEQMSPSMLLEERDRFDVAIKMRK